MGLPHLAQFQHKALANNSDWRQIQSKSETALRLKRDWTETNTGFCRGVWGVAVFEVGHRK